MTTVTTPSGHAPCCEWHCDQYDFECTCGLTRPATLAWAEAEVSAAKCAVERANERLAVAKAHLRGMEGMRP